MSTDPVVKEQEGIEEVDQQKEKEARHDFDSTPRSEVPIAVHVMAPLVEGEVSQRPSHSSDYFAMHPVGGDQHLPAPSSPSSVQADTSHINAEGQLLLPEPAVSLLHSPERPAIQTHMSSLSIESVDSSKTITAATPSSTLPQGAQRRPAFPNQSYAALQNQYHPVSQPPTLRQRSSHPGQIFTFTSALASMHQSGSRTVGNSPAVTPGGGAGLFTPPPRPPPPVNYESPETPGTYASPFLHFTHRQLPKETHVADVDVDPVSGRKIINHYEIIDELGRGTHGKVKLGRDLHTDSTYVAIKIVERFSKRRKLGKLGTTEDKVKKEVAILKKARHPHIVALLEVIDDPSRKKVYIVLEWVERGEINWRTKSTRKEIAVVEARRYDSERSGKHDAQTVAEDEAVLALAQKQLRREKRLIAQAARRTFRESRDEFFDSHIDHYGPVGDDASEESDDEKMSRLSTATGDASLPARLFAEEGRRASRAPFPLPPMEEAATPNTDSPTQFLPLTSELPIASQTISENGHDFVTTGLEGTMYGAYVPSSGEPSRVPSLTKSLYSSGALHHHDRGSSHGLTQLAAEILDSDLNSELEYVPVMTMQQIRVAFRDTLLGLQYLHQQGIIHRDIKPPNLLATTDHRVKISDFGVSYLGRPIDDTEPGEDVSEHEAQDLDDEAKELAKTVGTPAFFAPELCITEPTEDPLPVTKAIDIWALGVTLFCMLFARTPYVDNEFVVMRQIADEEIYVPRKRLQPVNSSSPSRPSSQGRAFPPLPTGKRNPLDLVYEEIDDELYDLLKRLLTKDPRMRITLEEVRHHPWVLADVTNKVMWLEETDPSRQSQGKKIEVSKEDVNTAVVPLQFLDRVRSGIKKVGERLGFGAKPTAAASSSGRLRAGSSATTPKDITSPVTSSASSVTAVGRDGWKQSLRGDESIFSALKASREGEHPPSKSMAASPELERSEQYFDSTASGTDTMTEKLHPSPSGPSPPERSTTTMSTAESFRTVTPTDLRRSRRESPPPFAGLPDTPVTLESPGGSSLRTFLGSGSARNMLKGLRERSMGRNTDAKSDMSKESSMESLDGHGEPSLAVSQTIAAGHVSPPEALQDLPPNTSASDSPAYSRPHSAMSSPPGALHPASAESAPSSRKTSNSSIPSLSRIAVQPNEDLTRSPVRPHSRMAPESSAEDWQRAEDEYIRKLIRENEQDPERPQSRFDNRVCPPSPDDERAKRRQSMQPSVTDMFSPDFSHETSPTSNGQLPPAMASSSSDFGSAVSMSISNPSIPSVISEASSVDPVDESPDQHLEEKRNVSSDDTVNPQPKMVEEIVDEGYSPDKDQALDSDHDDYYESSDTDSDGGLVMGKTRRKSSAKHAQAVQAAGVARLTNASGQASRKERRGTGLSARSKKSSRSGSNNTMKKVRTRESENDCDRHAFQEVEGA